MYSRDDNSAKSMGTKFCRTFISSIRILLILELAGSSSPMALVIFVIVFANEKKGFYVGGYVPYNSIQMPKNPAGSVNDGPKSTCRNTVHSYVFFVAYANILQKWHLHIMASRYTTYRFLGY